MCELPDGLRLRRMQNGTWMTADGRWRTVRVRDGLRWAWSLDATAMTDRSWLLAQSSIPVRAGSRHELLRLLVALMAVDPPADIICVPPAGWPPRMISRGAGRYELPGLGLRLQHVGTVGACWRFQRTGQPLRERDLPDLLLFSYSTRTQAMWYLQQAMLDEQWPPVS